MENRNSKQISYPKYRMKKLRAVKQEGQREGKYER
jgi:hypothetical protein